MSGTEGYAEAAASLLGRYESIAFADLHAPVLHLIPAPPRDVLDIGAGSGRDAAALAAAGHRVVAVEPTAALRRREAMVLHAASGVTWLDDSLPALAALMARGWRFDLVMLTAVWMHLDAAERQRAMPNIAHLARGGGIVIMSLRHGPVPQGFRMFEVSAAETIDLARAAGLHPVLERRMPSVLPGKADVHWTRLALAKRRGSA